MDEDSGVQVLRRRLCDLSYTREFDLCMCLDALHRAARPPIALRKLVQAVVPGGKLLLTLRPALDPDALCADLDVAKLEIAPLPSGGSRIFIEV